MGQGRYSLVVVDDDARALEALSKAVSNSAYGELLRITAISSVAQLDALIQQRCQIDILLADIELDGVSDAGIQAVSRLFPKGSNTQVIYISGRIDHALEVYETQHVYFLAKPLDPARLDSALEKAIQAVEAQNRNILEIVVDRRPLSISTANIMYIESDRRKCLIHLDSHPEPLSVYLKLDDLEQRLPSSFLRCHSSFLVNLTYAAGLTSTAVVLKNGMHLPISRTRASAVKLAYARYMRGGM